MESDSDGSSNLDNLGCDSSNSEISGEGVASEFNHVDVREEDLPSIPELK